MGVSKIVKYLALVTVFAAVALADAAGITAAVQKLSKQIKGHDNALDKYDGSYLNMIPLASSIFRGHQASRDALRAINKSDSISEDDAPEVIGAATNNLNAAKIALDRTASKDQIADKNGMKQIGALLITHFKDEHAAIEDALKTKFPESSHAKMAGPMRAVGDQYDVVLSAGGYKVVSDCHLRLWEMIQFAVEWGVNPGQVKDDISAPMGQIYEK
ncbi:hypothetical protein ETB97_000434 [Aspergillus alliaceus]|uniref:Uncharacterized protein n=1 Tax=Petromyces alliaceus TaxID=209559 RepID=A0A8H6E6F7_PETAA|nr:hypothetical protein ETB97_000434 [Aspergillus burnettii]